MQPQRAAHRGEMAHQLAVETTLPPARNGPVEAGLMADGQTGFLPAPGGMGTEWLKIADHQIVIPAIQRSHVLPEAQGRESLEGTPARDAALMADETDAGKGAVLQGESVNILLNFTQFFETRIEYRFQIFTAHSCDFLLPSYARLA